MLVRDVGLVDGVPPSVLEDAIAWLDRAVTRAESRETTAVSVHLLEHALALVGSEPSEQRANFLLGRARGRATLRDMPGAHADIDEVLAVAAECDLPALRAQALTVRGDVEQRDGDLDSAGRHASRKPWPLGRTSATGAAKPRRSGCGDSPRCIAATSTLRRRRSPTRWPSRVCWATDAAKRGRCRTSRGRRSTAATTTSPSSVCSRRRTCSRRSATSAAARGRRDCSATSGTSRDA